MRFGNARQCIHDAFATSQTTPDRMEMGGTRYNSNGAIAHQAEAGLIIRAVLEQKTHLRAMCLFINAPDKWVKESELAALKIKLWADFVKGVTIAPREQGEIVAILDRLLLNFRRRCQNPTSGDIYTGDHMAAMLSRNPETYSKTVAGHSNRVIDILQRYDFLSLQPVWDVINNHKNKVQEEREKINPRTRRPYKVFPIKQVAGTSPQ